MNTFIKAISYYLPDTILTNEGISKIFPEWTPDKISSKLGINQRHVTAEEETSLDIAIEAAERLFRDNTEIAKKDIDYLIFCTQSNDYKLPTSACIIQNKLGLNTNIGAFDFNLGCSGYVYGLSIAKGLICGGIAKNVLLLTAETYTKYIHPKDKGNRTIFGDGASATVISTSGFAEILNFSLGTDGRGAENLIVKTGGSREPKLLNDLTYDENGVPISSDYLYMNGTEIVNFTLEAVPILVNKTLEFNSLNLSDVNLVIFHQANKYILNFMRKKIKIPEDKFYYCIENVGNTVSSTIPIAIYEAIKENKLVGNILLAGFGVGYSWGGVILRCAY